MGAAPEITLRLHPKQGVAFQTTATEVLYGGSAGGGKSHLMRSAATAWSLAIPGLQTYLFRRIREDLVKNHIEGPGGFHAMLAPLVLAKYCEIVEDEIRFSNGSKIYLCHCKDEKDRFKYLGAEIHLLLMDELTTFTDRIYRFLRSRLRMAEMKIPKEYEGLFPRVLAGSNPGNLGHAWVRAAFIDPRPPLEIEEMPPAEGGLRRQFIPSRLADNPSIDPVSYASRLEGLGDPALVAAMLDGDWNVVAGAFFPEFSTDTHVVAPRSLPAYWHRFRSFDWGSARPFAVQWWAVSDGELPEFPRGALICYREWYGARRDAAGAVVPNQGLRMTVEEVADGIVEREREDYYGNRSMGGVADPAIFAQNGGPSMGERMAARKCYFRPADNTRVSQSGAAGGWDQVRARLKGEDGRPMIYWFDTCREFIRTFPALQHDEARPEDLDSDGEDHLGDSTRYACLSRPYTAPIPFSEEDEPRDRYARSWHKRRHRGSAMAA
ncbi:MAG: terminase family protein [Patescibacteria group bacterium]|nr:terminase family protein [Patescibacteria group bacterium]